MRQFRHECKAYTNLVAVGTVIMLAFWLAPAHSQPKLIADPPTAQKHRLPPADTRAPCSGPWQFGARAGSLPHVASRVLGRRTVPDNGTGEQARRLRVVALGSSSTQGYGAASPHNAYPSQLEIALRLHFPGVAIEVFNAGIGGQTADAMVSRLQRDVFDLAPDLIIWQVGSNAVLRSIDAKKITSVLSDGIDKIRVQGTDLILMGMQYAPRITQHANHVAIRKAIAGVAKDKTVPVFDRFGLMQSWFDRLGAGQMQSFLHPDGLHMNDASYRCLAIELARFIAAGANPAAIAVSTPRQRAAEKSSR